MSPDNDQTQKYVPLMNGTMVSHYRIIEKIGAGGMGEVYLAEDTELNRKVALKFLPLHLCHVDEYRKRFVREAQAAAKLNHPNIVTIHEIGDFNGRPYMVSEFVCGRPLNDAIVSKCLAPSEVINIIIQVCEGLEDAHTAGIVHRDIKPSNIILEKSGRPKIVDFGLATVQGAAKVTQSGSAMGTIGYMSPEQLRGTAVDRRTDLFSVGIVLYESITGINPFAADNQAAVQTLILSKQPEPIARYKADLPEGLQDIVSRALEKERQVRYQSAADLAADLRRLRRRSSDSEHSVPASPSVSRSQRIRLRYVLPFAVTLLSVALWWSIRSGSRSAGEGHNHLAIVPFANLAGQTTSQAFCDGLMETLTSKLTQLAESEGSLLLVPASEIREKDVKSASQARKRFGVNLVLTGSIQQLGDKMRTTLNLVDAATERQLRSAVLDAPMDDISLLQDSSVSEVARLLNLPSGIGSHDSRQTGGTASSTAFSAYLEGRGYLQRHDDVRSLDSALHYFETAIRQDSNYALAYAGLGEVYWRRYNLTNDANWVVPAIHYSSRAVELNDHQAPVLVTLGMLHRATGQYQEAISYLKRALQIDSMDNETYVQLASAYESSGRVAAAESTYQRSISLRPEYWRSYYNLARYYAFRGNNQAALTQLATAASWAPEATFPYESLGSLYTFLGVYDRAKQLLERSLAIEPNYISLSNLGAIYQMEGDYRKAVDLYERALALNDKDYRVWSSLAWMCKMLPDGQQKAKAAYKRAIELAERNRQINPNDPMLICYLADCYWQIDERDTAVTMAQQAVQLSPENVEVLVRAGIIFEEAGYRDRALTVIGSAIRLGYAVDPLKATEELRGLVSDARYDSILKERR